MTGFKRIVVAGASALTCALVGCGPLEVQVTNETGADLVLDMPEAQEIIPVGTSTFTYKGAPTFNKRWTLDIDVSGDYVLDSVRPEAVRKELTELTFGPDQVNAFVVEFENTSGERIDSLFIQHPSSADRPLEDGLRPGVNYGSIAPGEALSVSLLHRGPEGYHFVYYKQGQGTVDASGRLNTEAAGQDVILEL